MTFSPIKPRLMRRNDPVLVSLSSRTDHGVTRTIFEISFTDRFLADMRWKKGDRIEIAIGADADAGRLRLKPSEQGYLLRLSGDSPRLRLSVRYWGTEIRFPSSPCIARPDTIARTLTIELPWQPRLKVAAQ